MKRGELRIGQMVWYRDPMNPKSDEWCSGHITKLFKSKAHVTWDAPDGFIDDLNLHYDRIFLEPQTAYKTQWVLRSSDWWMAE